MLKIPGEQRKRKCASSSLSVSLSLPTRCMTDTFRSFSVVLYNTKQCKIDTGVAGASTRPAVQGENQRQAAQKPGTEAESTKRFKLEEVVDSYLLLLVHVTQLSSIFFRQNRESRMRGS